MNMSMLFIVIAVLCLVLLFKFMGFVLRFAIAVIVLGLAYWYLATHYGWPAPHF